MPDPQQSLFETEPDPWQLDDQDDWLAARIVFADPPFGPYDYSIPAEIESSVKKGVRVVVPLGRGNRTMTGYCTEIISPQHPDAASVKPNRLKPITRVVDAKPLLDEKLLKLARQIADYYISPLGTVIETVVPVRTKTGRPMSWLKRSAALKVRFRRCGERAISSLRRAACNKRHMRSLPKNALKICC